MSDGRGRMYLEVEPSKEGRPVSGRHRTADEKRELGERARQLRAAGRSRREIQQELGIGEDLAKAFLRGVPLPNSLARPRAKDADREAAIALREAGRTYDQIAAELGLASMPREVEEWHDEAAALVEPQEEPDLPSALV